MIAHKEDKFKNRKVGIKIVFFRFFPVYSLTTNLRLVLGKSGTAIQKKKKNLHGQSFRLKKKKVVQVYGFQLFH